MGADSTTEEVRQRYVDAMGRELGELHFTLWNECVLLHWKWEEYVALFGTKPERITLLNQAAPSFFHIIQDTLWDNILLHIARLIDPPQSLRKDNLTIRRLPSLVHKELTEDLELLLQACVAKCEFVRDWRNRWIAHRDLSLALQHPKAAPLAEASRQAVKDSLSSIAELLNAVELHYCGSTVVYELHPPGNAEALLYVLWYGIHAEEDQLELMKSRQFSMKDLKRPPKL
jgi:hypothetical protein